MDPTIAIVAVLALVVVAWFASRSGAPPPSLLCANVRCAGGSTCDPATGLCVCPTGTTYDKNTGTCVSTPVTLICPTGSVLDPRTGTCSTPAYYNTQTGLIACPIGFVLDPRTGNCVSASTPTDLITCPNGYVLDPRTGNCVSASTPTDLITCPNGYVLDPRTGTCVTPAYYNTQTGLIPCPIGFVLDPRTGNCVPASTPADFITCPDGFTLDAYGRCTIDPIVCPSGTVLDPATGNCVQPPSRCPAVPCPAPLICNPTTGLCMQPPPSGASCPGGVDMMTAQPGSTVQIVNNTTEAPFHVFLEYANYNQASGHPTLNPPAAPWTILTASPGVAIRAPVNYYPADALPPGVTPPIAPPNAVGSATWQELVMPNRGDVAVLQIPAFTHGQPWSVRPLKFYGNPPRPCGGAEGDCGMPILIESGFDMVGDMSAVDGVNFLLCYEFTTRGGVQSIMNFKTNPCRAAGMNIKGCTNPSVDGIFDPALVGTAGCLPAGSSHCWLSLPCPAGTCNMTGKSKAWCDAIHDGQCANSASTWTDAQRGSGGPDSCSKHNLYTTYCYSHDDATSSPYFSSPYKMKLVYSDLA